MLDTLKYAKRLQQAGFTEQQAEAQADALWEAIEDSVATKQDVQLVRQDLRALGTRLDGRIDQLETRMDGRFNVVDGRFRLVYWMLGFNLALTLFTFSLTAGVMLKLLAG